MNSLLWKAICGLLILGSSSSGVVFAQVARREVIARIAPGSLVMPSLVETCAPSELQWCSPGVYAALSSWSTESIEPAFPDFVLADTLATASRTGEVVRVADWSTTYIFRSATEHDADSLVAALILLPDVVYAEINFVDRISHQCPLVPNDPRFGQQWGLQNPAGFDIDATDGWCSTTGGDIMVGVMDTGVDQNHEDLGGKVTGEGGITSCCNFWPCHGTHVAGVIAAVGNNALGIAGRSIS